MKIQIKNLDLEIVFWDGTEFSEWPKWLKKLFTDGDLRVSENMLYLTYMSANATSLNEAIEPNRWLMFDGHCTTAWSTEALNGFYTASGMVIQEPGDPLDTESEPTRKKWSP